MERTFLPPGRLPEGAGGSGIAGPPFTRILAPYGNTLLEDLGEGALDTAAAAECAVELRAGTARLSVQFGAFCARVQEFCAQVLPRGTR